MPDALGLRSGRAHCHRQGYGRPMEIQGYCDERFSGVRDAFAANFDEASDPTDVGASVAITVDGDFVVDLWGGTVDTDTASGVPWERDTIVNVWSSTKTLSALCCLILADQGELDLYAPVAKVWPEFAANGKQDIAMRHVMSHTAGLSGWRSRSRSRTSTTGRR
jgi:CubicO group peptidase (beta-lactamase class C family)